MRFADAARVELPDHGVIRTHVAVIEIAAHCFLHRSRCGTDVAVIEVDDRAVGCEFIADRDPEIFVSRDFFGRTTHSPKRARRRAGHNRGTGGW